MATLKLRFRKKNSSGTYDIVHMETDATVVCMSESDSTTVASKISSMDTAIAGKASSSHTHSYLPLSGGTLTGTLTVGSSSIGTNGYIQGTWLRTDSATYVTDAHDVFVESGGWLYKQNITTLRSLMGAPNVQVSSTAPTNQTTNDMWFKPIS